jgi:hypothetical protein
VAGVYAPCRRILQSREFLTFSLLNSYHNQDKTPSESSAVTVQHLPNCGIAQSHTDGRTGPASPPPRGTTQPRHPWPRFDCSFGCYNDQNCNQISCSQAHIGHIGHPRPGRATTSAAVIPDGQDIPHTSDALRSPRSCRNGIRASRHVLRRLRRLRRNRRGASSSSRCWCLPPRARRARHRRAR